MKFSKGVSDVNWSDFETAYGSAAIVETQLTRLASSDSTIAMNASHDLWCGLCHQHAYISSAALPALPFLIEAYHQADEKLKVELLDIFLGFAVCLNRSKTTEQWKTNLLKGLLANLQLFKQAKASENELISSFGDEVLLNLDSFTSPPST